MVCLGNICRSPMAEGVLKHKAFHAGLSWTVQSAGTNGSSAERAATSLIPKEIALQHGIDISWQRARNFMADDFQEYDKIYALAKDVIRDIRQISKNLINQG